MPLLAGTAVRDISPRKPMFLVGYPHVERISTGIHDPLLASALYLNNGSASVLLVALDILFLDPPTARELRRTIARKTHVPESGVFISCSHTHSGPVTLEMLSWQYDPVVQRVDPGYVDLLKTETLAAAVAAATNPRPAELAWTSATVDGVGCNRHDPDGPRDPEAPLLVVRDPATRKIQAISLTYSMHPTVLHEDSRLVSSDFPAYTRLALQEAFGRDCTVLYHTGPAGNQSPRYHVRGQTFEEAERLGRRLGDFAHTAIEQATNHPFDNAPILNSALAPVQAPTRSFPSVADAEAALVKARTTFDDLRTRNAGHGPVRTAECAWFGAEETVVLARAQADGSLRNWLKPYTTVDVQALRIGNRCMAGLPGEVFIEYSLALKRMTRYPTAVVSLVNGELQGYVVTEEAARAGGYEASNSMFAPVTGTLFINYATDLIARM